MVTKQVLFLALLFWPVVGYGQITSILTEHGNMLPSRGAFTVVRGTNLATATETAVDMSNLPTNLGGVSVDINGVPCRLRYVSPDVIRMVVADETPFVPPVRINANAITITVNGRMAYKQRVYLNDTSPWLLPENATEFPVGISYSLAHGIRGIAHGVIEASTDGDTRIQLWATGARSFYPADWVYYYVYLIDSRENVYEIPAWVTRSGVVDGVDYVAFDLPVEYAHLGECRLLLRTPSAFSQEVKISLQ